MKLFLILGNQLFSPQHLKEFSDSFFYMSEDHGLCTMCQEKPAEYEPYYARSNENYLCKEWDCWAEWMTLNTHEIGDY